jgi:hypothetical protein
VLVFHWRVIKWISLDLFMIVNGSLSKKKQWNLWHNVMFPKYTNSNHQFQSHLFVTFWYIWDFVDVFDMSFYSWEWSPCRCSKHVNFCGDYFLTFSHNHLHYHTITITLSHNYNDVISHIQYVTSILFKNISIWWKFLITNFKNVVRSELWLFEKSHFKQNQIFKK